MHPRFVSVLLFAGIAACRPEALAPAAPTTAAPTTAAPTTPSTGGSQTNTIPDGALPVFVLAGQSNAEGNVRLGGLEAIRDALPAHDAPLSSAERAAARIAYQEGIGDWCNPAEDMSDAAADAAIDALRAGALDLVGFSAETTLEPAEIVAYRWRFQEASEALDAPYQSTEPDPPAGHTTDIAPLGVGFGVWDDEETDVLFYGPELGFGLHLDQTGALGAYGMVKVAMGGSSLAEHWAPGGPLEQELHARTADFRSQQDATVAGLIWFQGFNDQFDESARAAYADNLSTLIRTFREAHGAELGVVIVQARRVGDLAQIAAAQQTVADTLERVALVETDGLSECFHYDATSMLVIGQQSAAAMVELLGGD